MKDIISLWNNEKRIKKAGKDERANTVYHQLDTIVEFFLFKRYKEKETLVKLYEVLAMPKFSKALLKVAKEIKGDNSPNVSITLVIADFLKSYKEVDEETKDRYIEITKILLKPLIKQIQKETGLDEPTCIAIASTVPSKNIVKNPKYVGRYVQNLERTLATMANIFDASGEYIGLDTSKFDNKVLKKIVKILFKKETHEAILISIALDRKSTIEHFTDRQKSIWNVFTYYLLQELENMDKKVLKDVLAEYVKQRSNDKSGDQARRTLFSELVEEDYKNINKIVAKLVKKDKIAERYL